jgi:hypothetical protein
MDWGREMAFINHFYFYLWDSEWGAAFWKTNACAPFPIWLWLNGHEWAKRQLDKARIGYEPLENGFRSCTDAAALQKICDRVGPAAVQSFFARRSRRLPSVFTQADRRAGYGYEMAFRQFEREGPKRFLGNFEGILQSDGCGGYNLAENAIRPVALGRKNWIHIGSPEITA